MVNKNADRSLRKPNALQTAATELFEEITNMRKDFTKQTRNFKAISKKIQRKLNL